MIMAVKSQLVSLGLGAAHGKVATSFILSRRLRSYQQRLKYFSGERQGKVAVKRESTAVSFALYELLLAKQLSIPPL